MGNKMCINHNKLFEKNRTNAQWGKIIYEGALVLLTRILILYKTGLRVKEICCEKA